MFPIFSSSTSGNIKHGELQGSATSLQLPDVPCYMAILKAASDNAGSVYIGSVTGVTVKDGTTDTTTGFELTAGQAETFYVTNLNLLFRICTNAGDDLTYVVYV